jgi:hypothetical protein
VPAVSDEPENLGMGLKLNVAEYPRHRPSIELPIGQLRRDFALKFKASGEVRCGPPSPVVGRGFLKVIYAAV